MTTGIMTWANLGFSETFLASWGRSFLTAMLVMMPIAGLLMVAFTSTVNRLFPGLRVLLQNLLIGLAMSLVMQSIMAVITAANTVGFDNFGLYGASWSNAFLTALPVGIIFAVTLTTVIKPRLEVYLKGWRANYKPQFWTNSEEFECA